MSFNEDFDSIRYTFSVSRYKEAVQDKISFAQFLESKLEPKDFKELFKYIIYTDTADRTDNLDKLLGYARTHLSTELKFPAFLAERWFYNDKGVGHSALVMMACMANQDKALALFSKYIKEAKITNPSLSFVASIISMLEYGPDINSLAPLIECHTPEELNKRYTIGLSSPITLLIKALTYDNNIATIERLLQVGCDPNGCAYPNSISSTETTPIKVVLDEQSSKEKKKRILDAFKKAAEQQNKENPLLVCHQDLTPLMWAANIKDTEIVEILLEYPEVCSSINAMTKYADKTPLMHALILNQDAIKEREEQSKAIIKNLLDHGASAYSQDKTQRTPLIIAATTGPTLAVFEFLFDSLSKSEKKQELIKLINHQDEKGLTFLNHLLGHKKTDRIKAIIEKIIAYGGKDLTIFSTLTKYGRTALDFAEEHLDKSCSDYNEIIALIAKYTPLNETQQKLMQLKNASHLLGFKSDSADRMALNIAIQDKVEVRAEGFEDKFTFPLLIEALTQYIKGDPEASKDFQEIKEAFEVAQKAYLNIEDIECNSLFERYKNNKIVIIPSGWSGHSITLALYQDKLIISNRGDQKHSDGGVTVFQLKSDFIAQNKAEFSEWIKNISGDQSSTFSGTLMNQLAENIVSPEPSTIVATLDLTATEESNLKLEKDFFTEQGTPKRRPLLVQEWTEYVLDAGEKLPENKSLRTRNSCFLAEDALYQIDDQGEAKKISIKDIKELTKDLMTKLAIERASGNFYISFQNKLKNSQFQLFKKLIEAQGGSLDNPLRRKQITYYYQSIHKGNGQQSILDYHLFSCGLNFETAEAFIKNSLTAEKKIDAQEKLLKIHKAPLLSFPSKEQRHKTCAFANKKSIIEAMLYFLQSGTLTPGFDENDKAKQKARKGYKKFTETMRDQYVDRLLSDLNDPKKLPLSLLILGKLLDTDVPMKESRIVRQFKIVNHILRLNEKESKTEFAQFIKDRIAPFNKACVLQSQENYSRLAMLRLSFSLLIEEQLFKDTIIESLLKLNTVQVEQFNKLFQYFQLNKLASEEVVLGALSLTHALEDCTKLLYFKNSLSTAEQQNKYGADYTESVDRFVKKSITLITDSKRDPNTINEQLKTEAEQSFKHRSWGLRLFLDAVAIIATLGCILIYSHYKHGRILLFSHDKTDRQISFETLLPQACKS